MLPINTYKHTVATVAATIRDSCIAVIKAVVSHNTQVIDGVRKESGESYSNAP